MATNPDLQRAMNALRRGQFDEADALLSQVLASQPGNVPARWLLIQSLDARKDKDDALEQLRLLLMHVKNDLPAIDQVAGFMREKTYPLAHVLRAYDKYPADRPDADVAAFNYAYNLGKDGQFDKAITSYKHALGLGIDRPEEIHLNIANIYMDHLHDHDAAREHLYKALELNPTYASAFYNLANLAEQEGNRDEARLNFRKCLEIDPGNEAALARLADTQKFSEPDDPVLDRLARVARESTDADVHMALGKACEQLRDFDKAWQHFSRGNELDRGTMPAYRPQDAAAYFGGIAARCDKEWLRQFEGTSHEAVFICGMFRSGSTLLEQMLAAHPRFQAGGESEFFPRLIARETPGYPQGLESLTAGKLRVWQRQHAEQLEKLFGGSHRVTDKRPDNFRYIGLIKAVLPSAKFIVTERDWRDIATSIYSVRLGPSQNYATNLKDIHHYIGLQTELIDHWEKTLGPDLRRVSYEDLVQRPSDTVTGLLDWLGEDWDEQCLAFHQLKNSVKTASVWQVREPLHTKSVGRWEHYRRHFAEALGADLDA